MREQTSVPVFCKSCSRATTQILTTWAQAADDERCHKFHFQHPREQLCLNALALQFLGSLVALKSPRWTGMDGSWILHTMTGVGITRTWASQKIALTFGWAMLQARGGVPARSLVTGSLVLQAHPELWATAISSTAKPTYEHVSRGWR